MPPAITPQDGPLPPTNVDASAPILAIILGASYYPESPKLADGRPFYISASDIKDYLNAENGLRIPRRNLLSLFDDSRSPTDQMMEIARFLSRRAEELRREGTPPEDLLIYYVGHGLFTRGDQSYCLAVRCTSELNEGASSIRASDLASVVREHAAFLRRFLVLDCCFSASIYKEFQSGPLNAVRAQIHHEFPGRGTALLCSSSPRDVSIAPAGLSHTMFTSALIKGLREGHPSCGRRLSFSELGSLVEENLRTDFPDNWVRPEIHSPDQREGDVADVPLFPNPAYAEKQRDVQKDGENQEAAARAKAEEEQLERARAEAKAEAERFRQQSEKEKQERDAAEAERKRLDAENAAAKAKADRMRELAENEKQAREAAEAVSKRLAAERTAQAEANRLHQADTERKKRDAAEAERKRMDAEKAEADRLAKQRLESQRAAEAKAASEKAAQERSAQLEAERRAKEEAERSAKEEAQRIKKQETESARSKRSKWPSLPKIPLAVVLLSLLVFIIGKWATRTPSVSPDMPDSSSAPVQQTPAQTQTDPEAKTALSSPKQSLAPTTPAKSGPASQSVYDKMAGPFTVNELPAVPNETPELAKDRAAVEKKPRDPDARDEYGRALQSAGYLDQAIEQLRAAVKLPPKDYGRAFLYRDLGEALEKKGDLDGALAAMRVSVVSWPVKNELFCGGYERGILGRLLEEKGDTQAALEYWKKLGATATDPATCQKQYDRIAQGIKQ